MSKVEELRERYRGEILRRDVDLILSDLLGKPMSYVLAHGEVEVPEDAFESLAQRRLAGEPLQYIRGRTEFFGREFFVDDRVLIPRPETELLVEAAIARIPSGARVLDVGTGSGCIAISLADARSDLHVFAIDVSVGALAVARRNWSAGLQGRLDGRPEGRPLPRASAAFRPPDQPAFRPALHFAVSDLFASIRGEFDAIVSNPPYIPAADVESLATEVRDHEPRNALTLGPRGTEVIERLFVAPLVMFEIGFGQEHDVCAIAHAKGFRIDDILPDLAGIPRVVVASNLSRA